MQAPPSVYVSCQTSFGRYEDMCLEDRMALDMYFKTGWL